MGIVEPFSEEIPSLVVRTAHFAHDDKLLEFLDEEAPLFFEHETFGLVGQGTALEKNFAGGTRFSEAGRWWNQLVEKAEVTDPLGRPGTGLSAFARFAFSDVSTRQSTLVIPRTIVGRDSQGSWITTIDNPDGSPRAFGIKTRDKSPVDWIETPLRALSFTEAAAEAIRLIQGLSLEKVVLGRQITAQSSQPIFVQALLDYLSTTHPKTYRFAFEFLVGASPEMLSRVIDNHLFIEVLAGSAPKSGEVPSNKAPSETLLSQEKDLLEHELAVSSVVDVLRSIADLEVSVGEASILGLRDVLHLSTSIKCSSARQLNGLDLLAKLHPTASVAGTPREQALRVIRELEGVDRGYFAGPVGWLDAKGNQEFVLALRSAELSSDRKKITAFAGAGIVHDSVPSKEFDETTLKFKTIQDYFV